MYTEQSLIWTMISGIIAGLGGYLGSYIKVKAEVRAATDSLRQTIENLRETTRTVEIEKARILAESTLESDLRKAVYGLAATTQSLLHSMCWLSWSAQVRHLVKPDLSTLYDAEAHKLVPEIFGQMAVIKLLNKDLHARATPFVQRILALDVDYGNAIVIAETDGAAGTARFVELHDVALGLSREAEQVLGRDLAIPKN